MTAASVAPPLLFLAGTDTGVGKTTVALGLLTLARRAQLALVPFKPAETGFTNPISSDAGRLLQAAVPLGLNLDEICPHRFAAPVAPAAAAEEEGRPIALASLLACARSLRTRGDGLLVEGAGGLLSPYGPSLTGLDLAVALGAPVLLISRNTLGTINHTALALAALQHREHPVAGVLLIDGPRGPTADQASNARWIERLTGHRPLGLLPFLAEPTPEAVADALAPLLDVRELFPSARAVQGPSSSSVK